MLKFEWKKKYHQTILLTEMDWSNGYEWEIQFGLNELICTFDLFYFRIKKTEPAPAQVHQTSQNSE